MYQQVDYKLVDKLREVFPSSYQGQLFFEHKPKKQTYEVAYYLVYNGQGLRCDAEVNEEVFSTPVYHDWTDEDVDRFVQNIAFQVNAGLEEFE